MAAGDGVAAALHQLRRFLAFYLYDNDGTSLGSDDAMARVLIEY